MRRSILFVVLPLVALGAGAAAQPANRAPMNVLFIGNSRMYYNDMPAMLRKMADSARAKERFDIVMRALPAGTLQLSWNDPETRRLLKQQWHDVVVQVESNAQTSERGTAEFFEYGERLIR